MQTTSSQTAGHDKGLQDIDQVVIRFAGDSGDGMQLTGDRFTQETARSATTSRRSPTSPPRSALPPARCPGVSSFQLHFANYDILTPGDAPDVLVAMNPAALKVPTSATSRRAVCCIVNTGEFTARQPDQGRLRRRTPLDDGDARALRAARGRSRPLHAIEALEETRLLVKRARTPSGRRTCSPSASCRGCTAARPSRRSERILRQQFAKKPGASREANVQGLPGRLRLRRDHRGVRGPSYEVPPAGCRRAPTATSPATRRWRYGLVAGAQIRPGCSCSSGATRSPRRRTSCTSCRSTRTYGVIDLPGRGRDRRRSAPRSARPTAVTIGVTTTSGPGVALKSEAIGLAVMTGAAAGRRRRAARRPVDRPADQDRAGRPAAGDVRAQRRGAGAGGRPASPGRLLRRRDRGDPDRDHVPHAGDPAQSDGYLANGSEPWRVPDVDVARLP